MKHSWNKHPPKANPSGAYFGNTSLFGCCRMQITREQFCQLLLWYPACMTWRNEKDEAGHVIWEEKRKRPGIFKNEYGIKKLFLHMPCMLTINLFCPSRPPQKNKSCFCSNNPFYSINYLPGGSGIGLS